VSEPPFRLSRPRLLARLDDEQAPVTVVSAPAGWGKSTLLASWATGRPGRTLLLAGTRAEGFWPRVLSAVTEAVPGAPPVAGGVTATDGPHRLTEALQSSPTALTIVVDDCNEVAGDLAALAQAAHDADARTRLVLACRGEPAVPLHRWRVDGRLAELSSFDLAFTIDETAELLAGHGLMLPWAAVTDLHARAEGWAAGLRLAAMALQHDAGPVHILAGSADTALVDDYLTAEVLGALDPQVRTALVQVSVSERLTGGLVDAVTERVDGAAMLADLQRRGAFLVRCAGAGDTYRVHAMLRRTLYRELARNRDRAARAHHRAAGWHLAQGPPADALRHLLAAGEWESAVQVADGHWAEIVIGSRCLDQPASMIAVPDGEAVRHLWLAMAAERLDAGDAMAARHRLRRARAAEDRPDPAAEPLLPALDLAAARLDTDLDGVRTLAAEMLSAPDAGRGASTAAALVRPLAMLTLGAAELQRGQPHVAARHLQDALTLARQRNMGRAEVGAASHLAACHAAQGHLRQAAQCAGEALDRAGRLGLTQLTDLGWSRLALAEAYFQWNRLGDAERCAAAAVDGARGDRLLQLWATVLQARLRTATGRLSDAHRLLRAAGREMTTSDLPAVITRALSLAEGELRLGGGDLVGAREHLQAWRNADPLPAQTAVLEGSVLLAEGRPAVAAAAVEPYLADDGTGSRTYRASAGLISALAGAALSHREQAMRGLDVALRLAEQEDLRRCFVSGGHPVRALIESVAPMMPAYSPVASVLTAAIDPAATDRLLRPGGTPQGSAPAGSVVPPLTSRELTVLRYLQGTLSHVEIAALLYISVNTVKTHVKNIYAKLGANRRKDAIRRGHELRLL
jgi:LuxR family maltose regulon positive regulatory protein